MNRFARLAAAVALAMPVVAFAQDERDVAPDAPKEPSRQENRIEIDDRTDTVILSEVNADGGPVVRIEAVPEKLRAELETLRHKLAAETSDRVKAELKRAMADVERARDEAAAEGQRATAESKKARALAQVELQKAQAELQRAHAAADVARRQQLAKKVEMEKAAFLGVGGSPVPQVLREQLKLPKGVGLVVEAVEPDSPAASAGLKRYDVLHKLNDQLLINTHQLAVLVRSFKPGDAVKLSYFREGKEQTAEVKLTEKQLPAIGDSAGFNWDMPALPRVPTPPLPPDVRSFENLKKEWLGPDAQVRGKSGVISRAIGSDGRRLTIQSDGDHSISLSDRDGKKHLKVTDKAGKTLFDGPFDTQEDREKLPEELRGKIRVAEDVIRFNPEIRLKLGERMGEFEDWKLKDKEKADGKADGKAEGKADGKFEGRFESRRSKDRGESDFRAVEWSEDDQRLRVEVKDGKKMLSVKDKEGKEVFNGPIDTEEQRKALPDSVREKLDSSRWQSILKQLGE